MDETRKIAKLFNSIKLSDFNKYFSLKNNDIYHYTSPDVFNIIINDNTLRFSDRLFLNDKSEGSYVLDVCLELIKSKHLEDNCDNKFYQQLEIECKKKISNPEILNFRTYQISFSIDEDNLALWNYYTKGDNMGGFNLKFDAKKILDSLNKKINEKKKLSNPPVLYGGKVVYDKYTQFKVIEDIILKFKSLYDEITDKEYLIELLVRKILIVGTFFKQECFKFENEYRIVIDLYMNDDGEFMTIENGKNVTNKNGYLIPSVDIEWNQEALIGVTVSPTLEFDGIKRSILNVINGKYTNISDENIKSSKIPVRY